MKTFPLVLAALVCSLSTACAQSPGPQEPPMGPPQDRERRERIERLTSEIRELEAALKRDDVPAERRDELKKRIVQKRDELDRVVAERPAPFGDPRSPHDEKMKRLHAHMQELERALENPDLPPEKRKELSVQLDTARARMSELRADMKRFADGGMMDPHRKGPSGTVTAVSGDLGLVVISLGRDAGVREGEEFTIFRDTLFVGKIAIDRVDRAWASGRVILKGKEEPRIGDNVVRNSISVHGPQDPRHGPPPDPELHKIHKEAMELERASMDLSGKLRMLPPESKEDRAGILDKLKDAVTRLFDLREKARAREVELLKKRLDELTQMLDKRKANRDAIIEKRLKQLSGESDDLDW